MIAIAAVFLIAIAMMGASFEALHKDHRRFKRTNNARANNHFARL